MIGNPYMNNYNPQAALDRINSQMAELERQKTQLQQIPVSQPTNLTQNFQLAPNNYDVIKFADSIEQVQKNMVIGDTPFFSRDMGVVWIKSAKGDIRVYELKEIVPKDEKDIQIELLQAQIDELKKGMAVNEQHIANDDESKVEADSTGNDESVGAAVEEGKSSSSSAVSTSKTK